MRKIKPYLKQVSKHHMSKFEQLQHIRSLTKTFVAQFHKKKIITKINK